MHTTQAMSATTDNSGFTATT